MQIAIIDAQGAGLGQTIIKRIRKDIGNVNIIALGTNAVAAANMLRAGAQESLYGEKCICEYLRNNRVDCIVGAIGVLCSGGILGEITPDISEAVLKMECIKYIMPLQMHGIYIPGTRNLNIKDIIEEIVMDIKNRM